MVGPPLGDLRGHSQTLNRREPRGRRHLGPHPLGHVPADLHDPRLRHAILGGRLPRARAVDRDQLKDLKIPFARRQRHLAQGLWREERIPQTR